MVKNILLAALVLFVFGCSEDREAKPLTYPKVFTGENQKTWVIEGIFVTKAGEPDLEFNFSTCELDDRYTFKADAERSYIVDNGPSKCDVPEGEPAEEDVYVEHNWSFVNATSILTIAVPRVFGNFLIPFIVKEVTKDRMVLEVYANQENTISYKVVMRSINEQ